MADSTLSLDTPFLRHPEQAQLVAAVIASWNTCEHLLAAILGLVVGTDAWHASDILGALASPGAKVGLVESAGSYTLTNSSRLSEFSGADQNGEVGHAHASHLRAWDLCHR